jgi:two-component system NarL family sensor kinase
LRVSLAAHEPLPPLPAAVEVAALHIVDEAVANAVRHARASQLSVSLIHHDDMLVVTIEDDGSGFQMGRIVPGIGLQSMRERARELGGTWEMRQRDANGGCVIRVALPAKVETP